MTKRLHKIEGFKPIEANSTIARIDVSILRNMLYIIIGGSKSKQNNFERGAKGHILLLFSQHFIQTSYDKVSVVRDGIPVINLLAE